MYNVIPDFDSYFFWKFKIENFDSLKEKVETDIESFSNTNKNNVRWNKDCSVDVINNLNPKEYLQYVEKPLNYIAEELRDHSEYLSSEALGWSERPINKIQFDFDSPWINIYNEKSFQEPHSHLPHALAVVMFLNDGKDYGQFYFLNPTVYPPPWHIMRPQCIKPTVEAGDIIVFPAYMLHGVTAHHSKEQRKTMALNVKMEFNY